jgi:hypothetical protein
MKNGIKSVLYKVGEKKWDGESYTVMDIKDLFARARNPDWFIETLSTGELALVQYSRPIKSRIDATQYLG